MIRQQPGIREVDLRNMYTKREQSFVDEALLRLKSDDRVVWKEDGKSPRLYIQKLGSSHSQERSQGETIHGGAQGLSPQP